MGRLDELIREYCPEGVECFPLGMVCTICKGVQFNKTDMNGEGTYPVVNGGIIPSGYIEQYNQKENTITISQGGSSAGFVNWIETKFWAGAHCYVLIPKANVLNRYAFYFKKSQERILQECQYGAGIPALAKGTIESLSIPLPPLPVQREIVRILDAFTGLTEDLTAELTERRKQYTYYRDTLLAFDNNTFRILGNLIPGFCPEGVEYKTLGELGKFYGGITGKSKNDFIDGNAKFITYKNVYSNPALRIDVNDRVKIAPDENQRTLEYGDLIFTGSSETPDECGISSVLTEKIDEKLYLNSFCFAFRFNDLNCMLPEFAKHLFRSNNLRLQIGKTASGVTRFNVSKKLMEKVTVPLLPLPVQREIVRILDAFTEFTTELKTELTARRKQYAYYRDTLLAFDNNTFRILGNLIPEFCPEEVEYKQLWEVTTWDKRYNSVEKTKQPAVISYPYLLANELFALEQDDGDVFMLSTGEKTGWTNATLAGNHLCEGEVVTLPGGKSRAVKDCIKYYNGKFVTADNRIATSSDVNVLSTKYLYYWLMSQGDVIDTYYRGSGIKHPSMKEILDMRIPLPPLPVQEHIVSILDRLENLCNDVTAGLPAEIEARQRQYAFYRDKLLSFHEIA